MTPCFYDTLPPEPPHWMPAGIGAFDPITGAEGLVTGLVTGFLTHSDTQAAIKQKKLEDAVAQKDALAQQALQIKLDAVAEADAQRQSQIYALWGVGLAAVLIGGGFLISAAKK